MTPPLLSNSEGTALLDRPETQTQPTALKTGRELPQYRPNRDIPYVPLAPEHPNWARLDAYRQEAGRRGISDLELQQMEIGYCPAQVEAQIRDLNAWIEAHPA